MIWFDLFCFKVKVYVSQALNSKDPELLVLLHPSPECWLIGKYHILGFHVVLWNQPGLSCVLSQQSANTAASSTQVSFHTGKCSSPSTICCTGSLFPIYTPETLVKNCLVMGVGEMAQQLRTLAVLGSVIKSTDFSRRPGFSS